jgi:hypothetical protein
VALSLVLLSGTIRSKESYHAEKQEKLVVYNMKGKGIEIIKGGNSLFITDSSVLTDETIAQYVLAPAMVSERINNRKMLLTAHGNYSFSTCGKKVTILAKPISENEKLETDIVIITGNLPFAPDLFSKKLHFNLVVLDGSNSFIQLKKWKAFFVSSKTRHWDVAEKGAFILKLN